MIRGCHHGYQPGKCPVATCAHFPKDEPLHIRMFGPAHDSQLAAQIASADPARYAALRRQAQEAGLLPRDPFIKALEEESQN